MKCPNCNGTLYFDIPSQKLKCRNCESVFKPEEYEGDNSAEEDVIEGGKMYICQNCGAELISANDEAVSYCSYCGSEQILEGELTGVKKPKYIMPFRISKEECKKIYEKEVKGKNYVPKEFKDPQFIERFRPFYIPYWMYQIRFRDDNFDLKGTKSYTSHGYDYYEEYDVKATFFVVGREDEQSLKMYKRIVDEGHTLGMHSYSHKYNEIYSSVDAFASDIRSLQELLYETTGVWPRFYRFPGGSSTTTSSVPISDLIDYLNEQDITYFDWNIASGDAVDNPPDKDTIVNNCTRSINKYDDCVILMHDLTEKRSTVEALRILIPKLQEMDNVMILPITDETVPVQHVPAHINND